MIIRRISIFTILIGIIFTLSTYTSCGMFGSQEKFNAELKGNIRMGLELIWDGESENYQQIITLEKKGEKIVIKGKTPVRELTVYEDSYPINDVDTEMIFIYDLFLGWAIIDKGNLTIWKDFSELPKDKELLVKLRLMENPVLEFDGNEFLTE